MSSEDEAHEMVDATGTRRRLQALLANGHRAKDLVAALGVHTSCQRIIRSEKVSAVIRDCVTQLYGELENRLGPSDLARERYRGLGYLSPMWWDPDIIDDPDAEPAGIRVYMKIRVEDPQGASVTDECWWTSSPKHEWNVSPVCTGWASRLIRSLFVSGLGSVT
ncbi:hypothetical protein GCM10020255_006420 [Rhodococcus baikonurensis]